MPARAGRSLHLRRVAVDAELLLGDEHRAALQVAFDLLRRTGDVRALRWRRRRYSAGMGRGEPMARARCRAPLPASRSRRPGASRPWLTGRPAGSRIVVVAPIARWCASSACVGTAAVIEMLVDVDDRLGRLRQRGPALPCTARPSSARLEPVRNVRRDRSPTGLMQPPQRTAFAPENAAASFSTRQQILAHPHEAGIDTCCWPIRCNRLLRRRRRGSPATGSELARQPALAARAFSRCRTIRRRCRPRTR